MMRWTRCRLLCLLAPALLLLALVPVLPAAEQAMVPENLAAGKPVQALSEETSKGNLASRGVDGSDKTRWCASSASYPQWYSVDLGKPQKITAVEVLWESAKSRYKYKVLASADGQSWQVISDQSAGLEGRLHKLDARTDAARYLKLEILGSSTGNWASIYELRVLGDKLVPQQSAEVAAKKPDAAKPEASKPDAPKPEAKKLDADALKLQVKAPDGFDVSIFALPPKVAYPTCLTATHDGTLFVGLDPDGSLGKRKGYGKVLRLRDTNGDGVADEFTEFCQVDHPRGLIHERLGKGSKLWVLHPPHLTLYVDTDGDGKADQTQQIISDISTSQNEKRGADHTTNGIAMGIDGWIYIAVGDFGFANATGTDGRKLTLLGGGIVRVRPDGTKMELYAQGLRNIYDVAIDPLMNIFTRDNTNDGGNWNLRFSHIIQTGNYGYPRLFENYTQEILPALADHGGGSGCGAMYLHAPGSFPKPYDDCVLTCDWGTSKVYVHTPAAEGASFTENQKVFVSIPRPTDIDADATGQIFIASWINGGFSFKDENVGFIARLTPTGRTTQTLPDLGTLSPEALVKQLASPVASLRLASQREILARATGSEQAKWSAPLTALARQKNAPVYSRVAAIFTLRLIEGSRSNSVLEEIAADSQVREWALRALADDPGTIQGLPVKLFVDALGDANPRVRAAAAIALGRLGDASVAPKLLEIAQPVTIEHHAKAAPAAYVPHVAVQALIALNASNACLDAISGPHQAGALWALRYMHTDAAADGLIAKLDKADPATKRALLDVLARLYFREAEYDGSWWWGTRPDRTGPYYKRVAWSATPRIEAALIKAAAAADADTLASLALALAKHQVKISGLPQITTEVAQAGKAKEPAIDLKKIAAAGQAAGAGVGAMGLEDVLIAVDKITGDAKRGQQLFTQQGCVACHTTQAGQPLKGPHLGLIGAQYNRQELARSILRPGDVIAQGFTTVKVTKKDGEELIGFVSRETADEIDIRNITGQVETVKTKDIDSRAELPTSVMPEGLASGLSVEDFASLLAYLQSLK